MNLSIIIPVYNGEKYIRECLDSIFTNQSHDYEVIVVDDGSKDNSPKLLDQYALKEDRLKVIHKENNGVSSARNTGLEEAKGEWILFVDIDDLMEEGAVTLILEQLKQAEGSDIIFGNYVEVSESNDKLWDFPVADKIAEDLSKMHEQLLGGYLLNACWGKLYRRDIIEQMGLIFDVSMKMGEDLKFVCQYCKNVNTISGIHESIYRYRQLSSGAVITNRSKLDDANIRDFVKTIECKQDYASNREVPKEIISKMNQEFASNISANLNLMMKTEGSFQEKKQKAFRFLSQKIVNDILRTVAKDSKLSMKRRMISILYRKRIVCFFILLIKYSMNK